MSVSAGSPALPIPWVRCFDDAAIFGKEPDHPWTSVLTNDPKDTKSVRGAYHVLLEPSASARKGSSFSFDGKNCSALLTKLGA